MFSHEWIEEFDARRGIPRKANEQYLPAYQAFWAWTTDVGGAIFCAVLGICGAGLSLFAGCLLEASGLLWLVFWSFAVISLAGAVFDAYLLCWSYHLWTMSTSHGSARWARLADLIQKKLVNRFSDLPLSPNALPLAQVFGGRGLYLPPEQWLRHFVMFGPTGSGKSKTFFMRMIRAILHRSSCLVYDPKGELCEQTADFSRRTFRLDLNDPSKSDRWNFLPACRDNPSFACQIAGMMIGIEARQKSAQDPFWGDAEQLALTAILLHLAEVYGEQAIPAFAADFLVGLGKTEDSFGAALENSPSLFARQAYYAFRKSPVQTHGSVLIGLYNKLRPFTLEPARMVTTSPTIEEKERGCRTIDFRELRNRGTAIYLVVSEGAAEMYKELIATFLGQAVMEMRLDGVNEPKTPCFVLIDEAYQLNVSEVKRISGIGRGRGVGLGLGYQDLPQMYDQYGREGANAILGTIMTKIFLPGLDDVTAEYASKQLGETTIFSKTFQDFPGEKNDNTRYSEQKRALMHAGEVRQIPAHKELLIITETAPPIKAAFPPIAVLKQKFIAPVFGKPRAFYLGDVDERFALSRTKNAPPETIESVGGEIKPVNSSNGFHAKSNSENALSPDANPETDERLSQMVDETVSSVIRQDVIFTDAENDSNSDSIELKPLDDTEDVASPFSAATTTSSGTLNRAVQPAAAVILTKTIDSHATAKNADVSQALNGLPGEVRLAQQETYNRSLLEMNRSVV